jgi:sulfite reductase alpha subunit-like flavoprotein
MVAYHEVAISCELPIHERLHDHTLSSDLINLIRFSLPFTQPKDTFAALPYAVLGLGDTNYDKFCHMGKSIDKRLEELGGVRSFPLNCADEATGLEEVVEQWKLDIMAVIQKVHSSPVAAAVDVAATSTKETSNETQGTDVSVASLSLATGGAESVEPAGTVTN